MVAGRASEGWPSVPAVPTATAPDGAAPDAADGAATAAAASTDRDGQRARVYRAVDAWAARLDAARRGAPRATVAGSAVLLPAERRFGDLDAVAAYLARVLALPGIRTALGAVPPPRLRLRRGARAAHWEPPGTIAVPVPTRGEPWALRESVVLHELAHHVGHVTGRARRHEAPFPALLLALVDEVLGAEAALALRVEYGTERVAVGGL